MTMEQWKAEAKLVNGLYGGHHGNGRAVQK